MYFSIKLNGSCSCKQTYFATILRHSLYIASVLGSKINCNAVLISQVYTEGPLQLSFSWEH